ncbi:hypothetical protein J1N35_014920 [Gossypium stocksii]|uniref:RNase H type-1 domain-containing protein n=1 Tax=Gossypium stocksii TaxID=47602 RepID=A0A9D4A9U4_9ROSI|nr:hypothetical protein J1N35_014920 [Gossypium stocksii]
MPYARFAAKKKRLNIYFHEGIRQTIYQIVAFVKACFSELNYLEEALKRKKNTVITQLEPPFEDQVKDNFDATFLQQNNTAASGVVIRNNMGFVMGSCSYPINNAQDSTIVEALAGLQGVVFAEEMGFCNVIIEGSCQKKPMERHMRWLRGEEEELHRVSGWKKHH